MIQPPNKQWFCDAQCVADYAYNRVKKLNQKVEKKKHREQKQAIKSKTQWLNELQALVNKYVRLRDAKQGCISFDKPSDWQGQFHAGHYYSRGHSSSLRFNLHNIHKQCSVCNNHLSGNIGQYTPRIIEKIGMVKFEILTAKKADVASYSIDYIRRGIKIAKRAIKRAENKLT